MKTNYHTHSTFCDGKKSIEEMTLEAIKRNFDIIGFSSHAIYPYKTSWHIQPEKYEAYCNEVERVKEVYKDKIEVYKGFEADYFPAVSAPDKRRYEKFNPDYIIGSVHYIINFEEPEKEGYPQDEATIPLNCFAIDGSKEEVEEGIKNMFNGDGKKAVETYFSLLRDMIRSFDFDIIGHVDIFRKRNGLLHFVDESEDWYKKELKATAITAAKSGKIVEVNYGGIARGSLMDTYPSVEFLQELNKLDVPITFNSDAHNTDHLDKGLDIAVKNAKSAGYTEFQYFSKGKWLSEKI